MTGRLFIRAWLDEYKGTAPVFLMSAGICGLFALLVQVFAPPGRGTPEYDLIASNLAAGNGFVTAAGEEAILWRPPLYIFLLAGLKLLHPDPYLAVVAIQVLLHAFLCVSVFALSRGIVGPRAGWLAALLTAGYPVLAMNVLRLMPETLFIAGLGLLAVGFVVYLDRPAPGPAFLLGVLTGVCALTKVSIQFLPPFVAVLAFIYPPARRHPGRIAGHAALALAGVLLVFLPWTARNYLVSGEFILVDTSGGYTFWVGNRLATDGLDDDPLPPHAVEEMKREVAEILGLEYRKPFMLAKTAWASGEASSRLYSAGISSVLEHPVGTAGLCLKKLYRFWFSYIGESKSVQVVVGILQGGVLLAGLAGMCLAARQGKPLLSLVPLLLYFPMLHMGSTANVRYSVSVLPFVFPYVGFVLLEAYGYFKGKSGRS